MPYIVLEHKEHVCRMYLHIRPMYSFKDQFQMSKPIIIISLRLLQYRIVDMESDRVKLHGHWL